MTMMEVTDCFARIPRTRDDDSGERAPYLTHFVIMHPHALHLRNKKIPQEQVLTGFLMTQD